MKTNPRIIGGRRQRGQGMTEYIIIVALIAIAAIAVFTFFGSTVRSQMGGIAKELSGQSAGSAIDKAKTSADNAEKESKNKDLGHYTNDNAR